MITYAARTALTKARKGYLKDTPFERLLIALLSGLRENSKLDPKLVEEIIVGNVLNKEPAYLSRAAGLAAGFPATTAVSTVSRWCSSGLLATQSVANQIKAGCIDIGIAVGVENMSINSDDGAPGFAADLNANPQIRDLNELMPWTSENVARDFNITREAQDEWAAISAQRAEKAQKEHWVDDEILKFTTNWVDPKTGVSQQVEVTRDDGVRYNTTKEGLSKIRAAFPQWPPSTTTGGNASQVTDGAAALLLMRRDTAEKLGQPILGKFVQSTVVGLEPRIMGIGPSFAIPKLLEKVKLTKEEVDIFEINEAFASMVRLYFRLPPKPFPFRVPKNLTTQLYSYRWSTQWTNST